MPLFIQENHVFLDYTALFFCDKPSDQGSCTERFISAKHLLTKLEEEALGFTEIHALK